MDLLSLYKRESRMSGIPALSMAIISGIAQGVLLGIIIAAAHAATYESLNFRYFLLYAIAFAIATIGKRYALNRSMIIAEDVIRRVRIRIGDKLRRTELIFLENIGKEEIYTRVAQDTSQISEAAIIVINAWQSAIVLVFCILYLAILSKLAFFITLVAIIIAVFLYAAHQKTIAYELIETTRKETRFFEMLSQIVDGFKELKINRKKNDHHFEAFKNIATEATDLKVQTGLKFVTHVMSSQIFFYTLLGVIIFILPRFDQITGELLIRVTAAILFIIGPVNMLVTAIPVFARANNAVRNVYILEARIDTAQEVFNSHYDPVVSSMLFSEKILVRDLSFSYTDRNGTPLFTIGPLDLEIKKGETLFIVGGNGSGKTTLLKILTGLYYPSTGAINIDGVDINNAIYPAYRELFSIIFHEFHLFDKLYGLKEIDRNRVQSLLKLMELSKKTELVEDRFSNLHLSTGQRKRLALIVALLDDKQIYVFDEWAADQDPIFRNYFYETLLKDLKSQGKTIIAVSHDDRYFRYADRVLKMEFGQFIPIDT